MSHTYNLTQATVISIPGVRCMGRRVGSRGILGVCSSRVASRRGAIAFIFRFPSPLRSCLVKSPLDELYLGRVCPSISAQHHQLLGCEYERCRVQQQQQPLFCEGKLKVWTAAIATRLLRACVASTSSSSSSPTPKHALVLSMWIICLY